MSPVSIYPALVITIIAILTAWMISSFQKTKTIVTVKYHAIEGLRGYLALFVFICHACAYYYYFHTEKWTDPPSNLYSQFGYTSVVLFFMITGFLFSGKLIEGRTEPIDWIRFFISRILRLVPLYLTVLIILLVIVGLLSDFTLQEPFLRLVKRIIHWTAFTVMENPDINAVKDTWIIMAGVMWTFAYEWLFYLSLPLIGLVFYRTNYSVLILSFTVSVGIIIVLKTHLYPICFVPFAGGIIASFLVRSPSFCAYASKETMGILMVLCLIFNTFFFSSSFEFPPLLTLSLVFTFIACGNNLFGLLTNGISYTLGRMAYSIYLLHGPILFIVFNFIIGTQRASSLSAAEHWMIIAASTPLLLITSHLTYSFIEKPAMHATPKVTTYIKKVLRINSAL